MIDFNLDDINNNEEIVQDDSVLKERVLSKFTLNQVEISSNKETNQFLKEGKINEGINYESEEFNVVNQAFIEEKDEGIVFK
jgi:hypothetical protein